MSAQTEVMFDYISDVHVSSHVLWVPNQQKWESRTRAWAKELLETKNPESDLLILAGDYSEWNAQTFWLFDELSQGYEQVLYVTGNHDMYLLSKEQMKKYGKNSLNRLRELKERLSVIPNVYCLDGNIFEYRGKRIAGHSLWYQPVTQEDWRFYNGKSNDSKYIVMPLQLDEDTWESLPIPTYLYQQAMQQYASWKDEALDLIVSHVPPMHPDIVTNSYSRNACYDAAIHEFYAPNWVCGHQHLRATFEYKKTTFYMNAIGYKENRKQGHDTKNDNFNLLTFQTATLI